MNKCVCWVKSFDPFKIFMYNQLHLYTADEGILSTLYEVFSCVFEGNVLYAFAPTLLFGGCLKSCRLLSHQTFLCTEN